jgi:two-component system sensor histidine kinase YesM
MIMSRFEQIQAILAIQKRLDLMRRGSAYIKNARVYIPGMNRLISAVGGVDPISAEWTRVVNTAPDRSFAQIVYLDGGLYLCSAFPAMPINPRVRPLYVIIIELSVDTIREQLLSFNGYASGGTILESLDTGFRVEVGSGVSDRTGYIIVNSASEYLHIALYTYVSEAQVYGKLRRYSALFLLFSLVALAAVAGFFVSSNILIKRPVDLLSEQAELKQLQAQINPHFLYNSFFILYRMAKDADYEHITTLCSHLSEYYRYITRNDLTEVPLREELDHAWRYARIQLIRFGKRIAVDFEEAPEACGDIMVPHLILQPLLENAFNHGLKNMVKGGVLRVSFVQRPDTLVIAVSDNGAGLSEEALRLLRERMNRSKDTKISALANIHKRLRLKFGPSAGISVYNDERGGFLQEIHITEVRRTNRDVPASDSGR